MIAQVSLTPTESKKLIGKAVACMPEVQKALAGGLLAIRPSSSAYFIFEEIVGRPPDTNLWVCGVIAPKGACMELAAMSWQCGPGRIDGKPAGWKEAVPFGWLLEKGKVVPHGPLTDLVERMGPEDVFVKSVNALDPQGNVGVLMGAPEGGGIGLIMKVRKRRGFNLIFPAGLEKLIPIPIRDASRETSRKKCDYSMGLACSLLPCEGGTVVTELDAVRILTGARAVPIAAGGLGGAEGSVTMVIKGEKPEVNRAVEIVEQCKGARLPVMRTPNCRDCTVPFCEFPIAEKHWVI